MNRRVYWTLGVCLAIILCIAIDHIYWRPLRDFSALIDDLPGTFSKDGEPNPRHRKLVETIRQESIPELIANLANFDDKSFAWSSIQRGGAMGREYSASFQALFVVRLVRVRRLLFEGQRNPQPVIEALRAALVASLDGWPDALRQFKEHYNRTMKEKGYVLLVESDLRERYRVQALAATYLLAILKDYESLPILFNGVQLHDLSLNGDRGQRPPVALPLTLHAMHVLIESYPEARLNVDARRARDAYLAEKPFGRPGESPVTRWAEDDPRRAITDGLRRLARDQPKTSVPLLRTRWADGSPTNGNVSDRMRPILERIEAFIDAAFGKGWRGSPRRGPARVSLRPLSRAGA